MQLYCVCVEKFALVPNSHTALLSPCREICLYNFCRRNIDCDLQAVLLGVFSREPPTKKKRREDQTVSLHDMKRKVPACIAALWTVQLLAGQHRANTHSTEILFLSQPPPKARWYLAPRVYSCMQQCAPRLRKPSCIKFRALTMRHRTDRVTFGFCSLNVQNVREHCKAQQVCLDWRMALYKSHLLLLLLLLSAVYILPTQASEPQHALP